MLHADVGRIQIDRAAARAGTGVLDRDVAQLRSIRLRQRAVELQSVPRARCGRAACERDRQRRCAGGVELAVHVQLRIRIEAHFHSRLDREGASLRHGDREGVAHAVGTVRQSPRCLHAKRAADIGGRRSSLRCQITARTDEANHNRHQPEDPALYVVHRRLLYVTCCSDRLPPAPESPTASSSPAHPTGLGPRLAAASGRVRSSTVRRSKSPLPRR